MVLSSGLAVVIVVVVMRLWWLRRRLRALEAEAAIDPLTGAFNRRHLDACLAHAIERRRRLGEPASLLLFDVDRFKEVNDALGHPAGDDVLKSLVGVVGRRARKMDQLFRVGGEEFALLLDGARFADAFAIGEDIRRSVERARLLGDRAVTISVGVTELTNDQSARDWITETDQALYLAKRSGRNRVAKGGGILVNRALTPPVPAPKEIGALRPMSM